MDRIKQRIRDIPDFPKAGILFRDMTPLLRDAATLRFAVEQLTAPFTGEDVTAVAGMEARGFIFGALVARELGCGFVPLRKPGKLPYRTHRQEYALEYGTAALEVHVDALGAADRVVLIDDLIATGGTARASIDLMRDLGAQVVGCGFVVELVALKGRALLADVAVHALVEY